MSISVKNLTKIYGTQAAVNDLSFEARQGEILGFLGPNGAGKTTTMKMLTCFIKPTSGSATVCGADINENPIEVRRKIGYLPEHNPLYKDMYVREYLSFVAKIYSIPNRKNRIDEMVEQTGLKIEQNKKIRQLSKGFRQRVGLAQALIHDPEVLIFDEPTSGLDPNQIVEIRQLIKTLGANKTVVFSSHILQEVQALCDQAIIINKGKLMANDTIDALKRSTQKNKQFIFVEFTNAIKAEVISNITGIQNISKTQDNAFKIETSAEVDIRPALFELAVEKENPILEIRKEESSVEDVFQQFTQE